ncbi:Calcium-transporting ATPase 12, plasma membrane-type [Sesamum angolense]|uniref:Calcium-transporting ATPase 12, plasma membrane-type n=1 Tax=Sesamum angolense TaxID=2727404 RepID=A0AAE1WHX5_9LAMI|nr:Calcium-transporting ATPase 12, plasma membrane-type [Sesamum angolense]
MERVGNISILAQASPSDKLLMVECLKRKGQAIAGTFVLLQVFNQFNSRKLEAKNVFKGILTGLIIVLQVAMLEFLNKFAQTERLDWMQWAESVKGLQLSLVCLVGL